MEKGKNLAAQILGQKGGEARKKALSPERRKEIAMTAAKASAKKRKKNKKLKELDAKLRDN